MVETLHPGVVVDEQNLTPGPVVGVTTANGAMMGIVSRGAMRTAVLCNNWTEFTLYCGSFRSDSYLAYAAYNFFQNGGKRLYVTRIAKTGFDPATATTILVDRDGAPKNTLTVNAKSGGLWGNGATSGIKISIANGTLNPTTEFKITVKYGTDVVEVWDNVSMDDTASNYVEGVVNNSSNYIQVTDMDSGTAAYNDRPAVQTDTSLAAGTDGTNPDPADYDFSPFNAVDSNLMVATPGETNTTVIQAGVTYCSTRGDSVFIADTTTNLTPVNAAAFRSALGVSSSYCGLYYPWVLMSDPAGVGNNPVKYVPPSGFVMGQTCRTDLNRGVWKAAAGSDTVLVGALGTQYKVLDSDQDTLNPVGVNCIRAFTNVGIVIWGCRTLSNDVKWRYLNVRRLTNFVKSSFKTSFASAVFEINDETLWGTLTRQGTEFLTGLWKSRGLFGPTADKSFFIKCDSELNTQSVIDQGQLKYQVGIRPSKPAEFIIITISQWDGGVEASEA